MLLRPFLNDAGHRSSPSSRHTYRRIISPVFPPSSRGPGATAYLPAGAGVAFDHVPLSDGETVELGNTVVTAISTHGHAPRPPERARIVAANRQGRIGAPA